MTQLRLYVFGPPRLERDGQPIDLGLRKALALCVYLTISRQPQSRDALATLFWPDQDQREARGSLRRTLHRLSQAIGEGVLLAGSDSVTIDPAADLWIDAAAFEQLAGAGDAAAAVALYRDDFLAGFSLPDSPAFDEWQFFERERLRQQLGQLLAWLVATAQASEDWPAAADYARRWVALDQLHEPAQRALITAYARAGQVTAALRQYQELARVLEAELGAEPEEATTELAEAVRARRIGPAAPAPTRQAAPPAPPPARSLLVGREHELADILRLLSEGGASRLLTITGPGGTGKTHLAQAVIEQARARFADGACLVALADVTEPRGIAPAIAGAAGLPLANTDSEAELLAGLRGREQLIVLDNFEHLLERADLAKAIVDAAPGVRVLVTSRERLGTSGELVYTLGGLSLPTDDTPAAVLASGAAQLLIQQARLARPTAGSHPDELPGIARICRLVQGMPLALTLAASWAELLSFAEIADEIGRSLDILASDLLDIPARQRSVRAVFESSWQRLAPAARQAFTRLTVFRGGFTRQAAERVAGADLATLRRLANSSFLVVNTAEQRYGLHELLRQFAAEGGGEGLAATEDRHSEFYLEQLRRLTADLKGGRQQHALGALAADRDNLRAAWLWAARHGRRDLIGAAAEGLWLFYELYGDAATGEAVFADALAGLGAAAPGAESGLEGLLLAARGHFQARRGAISSGRELMERGVAQMRAAPAQLPLGLALAYLGFIFRYQDRFAEAERLGEESLALFAEADDRWGVALSLHLMGTTLALQGRPVLADQLLRACLELARAAGFRGSHSTTARALAQVLAGFGDYREAQRYFAEAISVGQEAGYRLSVAAALCERALLALELGELDDAERDFAASAELYTAIGSPMFAEAVRGYAGLLARRRGELSAAEAQLRDGLALARRSENRRDEALFLGELALLAAQQGDRGQAARLQEEALSIWRTAANEPGVAAAAAALATTRAALGAADDQVDPLFHSALDLALRHRLAPVALAAMVGIAARAAATGDPETARELIGLVERHPAANAESRALAAALASQLPPSESDTARPGVEPDWRAVAWQLLSRASDRPAEPGPAPTNLDARLPPLIGRDLALAELIGLLSLPTRRLVTLLGPGGIGKTRLAQEAGLIALEHFPDGAWFVALAPLGAPEQIVGAIAETLGFRPGGTGAPREQLLGYLRTRRLLLILDNFEHLLEGAELLDEILRTAPRLTLLVTSRERLGLSGEIVVPLGGIEVPPDEADEQALERGAVQLLLRRARLARPELDLSPAELDAAIRICRLVEGMPLALILAASWADMLSFAAIAAEIERSLDFLEGELRDLPARQRSMRAVFDSSWARLPAAAQQAFARLSLFRGGFSPEAAAQVAGADLRTLRTLLNSSFIVAEPEGRYDIHELLRQYGADRLAELGQYDQVLGAHSAYYLGLLRAIEGDFKSQAQTQALRAVSRELENIRLAVESALARADLEPVDGALDALYLYFELTGRHSDGVEWFSWIDDQLGRVAAEPRLRARSSTRLYTLHTLLPIADPERAEATLRRNLEIAADDLAEHAFTHMALSLFANRVRRDSRAALEHMERGLYEYCAVGDRFFVALLLMRVGYVAAVVSGIEHMYLLTRQSLTLLREVGDKVHEAIALANLAEAAVNLGRYDEAARFAQEALDVDAISDAKVSPLALPLLALVRLLGGDLAEARALAVRGYTQAGEQNNRILMGNALGVLSLCATLGGDPELGRRQALELRAVGTNKHTQLLVHWGLALAACSLGAFAEARAAIAQGAGQIRAAVSPARITWLLPVAAVLAAQEGAAERAAELLALASTHPLSATGWMRRWAPLSELRAQLEATLGPAAFAAAWERGAAAELSAAVDRLAAEQAPNRAENEQAPR